MKKLIALTIWMMFGVVGYGHVETNETHLHDISQTNVTTRTWSHIGTWSTGTQTNTVHICVKDITDEDIKELVKSGRVCKVIGHTWASSLTLLHAPGWSYRHCRLCKKEESRSLSDWK